MGILNVTPDSFADGGRHLDPDAAVRHGLALAAEGAAFVDVGAESTRPGAEPVSATEQRRRVGGVIEELAASLPAGVQISIDTSSAEVAAAALDAGATLVNDVTALRGDPRMGPLVAERGAGLCLMHMQGEPRTMQRDPRYDDVAVQVREFLAERMAAAVADGVDQARILLDPGFGFGKTLEHNLELLVRLPELTDLGAEVLVGTSRKGFLGTILARARGGPVAPDERLAATLASCVLALERGARVFRVHDVRPVADALAVTAATLPGRWSPGTPTRATS